MILSRHEYRMWVRLREPRFYPWSSPAWTHEPKRHPSQWFVKVKPIGISNSNRYRKSDYCHGVIKTCVVGYCVIGAILKIMKNGGDLLTRMILPYGS